MKPLTNLMSLADSYPVSLDAARHLPQSLHWAIGCAACLVAMVLENASGFAHFGLITLTVLCALAGLAFSVVSRLLMLLIPWPYAWLAHRVRVRT